MLMMHKCDIGKPYETAVETFRMMGLGMFIYIKNDIFEP